ncbi:hypothetical protein [Acinetobacter baumannii]|uniref:hypothetical protein n=1 Tax=Acinetobacter baumannii TaxID=470 RepID=UPI000947864D|nr:hypothetical protein [Acinetobacter baumannii]ATD21675.1 hypothetical protein BS098_17915 [Acinetobacter baumannii]AXG85439.1 hypothetical protein Aba810CP_11990 [Acinetobacter baumannii]EII5852224.1 hypothetical protein [Acinetobacter baumannii]EIR6365962.1 hypothetical protein [Acinetobacter baumannii]EJO3108368.1 hypothetical protein [Acinetobacter baumannii]
MSSNRITAAEVQNLAENSVPLSTDSILDDVYKDIRMNPNSGYVVKFVSKNRMTLEVLKTLEPVLKADGYEVESVDHSPSFYRLDVKWQVK